MNFNQIQNIIWDWNGTLLNDVEMCIECMNQLLDARNISQLNLKTYREVFTFPVEDYYKKIGINLNKESFHIIGHEFMDLYFKGLKECELFKDVKSILQLFESKNKNQFILSAMEQNALVQSLSDYKISNFFKAVYGIDNHLAAGKINRGIQLINKNNIDLQKTLLIGDTLHDVDVANKLGVECVLIANGHQNKTRLQSSGVDVFNSLLDMLKSLR